ncbi:MAG: regulatory iron-sulfur-containing complex subunit RicT [Bacteroidales bacterium]
MDDIIYKECNCERGISTVKESSEQFQFVVEKDCCKLKVHNWLEKIPSPYAEEYYEVRFKNTRKLYYKNDSGQKIESGDIVVVEAASGYDIGVVSMCGPLLYRQLKRNNISVEQYDFKKIFRKAKAADLNRWHAAISREHQTLIKARKTAQQLNLNMKVGDVEFQGDGTKAIFYYIADERVDFRQLIKLYAEEFRIRIEMKQIGVRQEAGRIGGIGVCGMELCCSRYMSEFKSITTNSARAQDLSTNPQKLTGQCGKLKCCINYEASTYLDAHSQIPNVSAPLESKQGDAYLVKRDTLRGVMWFSYEKGNMINMFPIDIERVKEIIELNRKGIKVDDLTPVKEPPSNEFLSGEGEESISRFDSNSKGTGSKKVKRNSRTKKRNRSTNVKKRGKKGEV